MLAKSAVQKLEIVKPLTTADTSIRTKALMTNKNRPIVITVNGSVNKISNGLTIALANPRSSAAIISEPPSAKRKPLNI
jgi:hypothetical protein